MASNNRKNIRQALKALLNTTSAGANVYTNRENPLWEAELPAIIIYTPEEPVNPASLQATHYNRNLQLNIEVKVEASSNSDDALDDLIAEVEQVVTSNSSISGTVQSTTQTNTETRVDESGETPIAVGTISFECRYSS